jgi:tetratricopeptide (TPR) repeat protein
MLGAAAALAAALGLLFGGVFRSSAAPVAADVLPSAVADQLQRGFAAGDTQALVSALQAELKADPRNVKAYENLGLAYQQRARETGDASFYTKADGILHRALALRPNDLIATAGLGQLALSRHRFRDALALGERARRISPTTGGVYGVIGDAELELGRYPQAFRAFDRMAAIKPGVASYARVSYARELLGQTAAAERAMRLAIDSAIGEKEAGAWTRSQLGLLYLSTGRPKLAAATIRTALELFPGYYFALDAIAQAQAALGRPAVAIAYERAAVDRIPLPQYVGFLGDLYRATGQTQKARDQYALIGVIQRLLAANGVKNDLDIALFDVDHGIRLPHALELARRGYRDRPSVFGDDVLAWALARNGRCGEALAYSKRALRLGTQDAVKFFHRGYVEACLGDRDAARVWYGRALALNPHFSILWAPVARKGVSS